MKRSGAGIFPLGHIADVPDMPGRWQVWSQANDAPGAYFLTPYDEAAEDTGVKYLVCKAIQKKADPRPTITIIRTEWR